MSLDKQKPNRTATAGFLVEYWKPIVSVIFWGASFIATKQALEELEPLLIIFLRQVLAISLLASIAIHQKKNFSVNLKNHGRIFILSLIASFHLWIQVTGLQYTSASNTGWIIGITPVFMVLLGFLFFKERISPIQIFGILVAFGGLLLLVGKGDVTSIDLISNKGDLLVLMSSFTWSVYSLVGKRITIEYSPIMTILFLFIMMSIIVVPFALTAENISALINLTAAGWTSILFLGLLCSGIAYVFWAESLSRMPASKVGAFLYLEPFVTVFTAWIFLNEEISLLTFVSGLIIIGGVILVNRK
ncbi:MAG TPA: DMT family transporter [Melioribacteraceae bacterium]|nr:DMT family transporter [Melioribacteraceae bacterium]